MPVDKKFRVLEIFGPTIQGEGRRAGIPCYFIRFGGCDFRCSWCDSPHAVLPEFVKLAEKLTVGEIISRLACLGEVEGPEWVVLSGGNPALLDLTDLVVRLHHQGYKVMVETQGTAHKQWLHHVDEICISPKPPSSGMQYGPASLRAYLRNFATWKQTQDLYLKIPIFDDTDYEWAANIHKVIPHVEMFLSLGNIDPNLPTVGNKGQGDPDAPLDIGFYLDRMADLMTKVANDGRMDDVRILPQLHVLAWGNERGR